MVSPNSFLPDITLPRLLRRQAAVLLLNEFSRLLPGGDLALVEMNGRVYAGSTAWQEKALDDLLAQARNAQVVRTLEVTGMEKFFEIYTDREAAIASFA